MVSLASSQNTEEQNDINFSYKSSGTLNEHQSHNEKDRMNLTAIDEVNESREGRLSAEIKNFEFLK